MFVIKNNPFTNFSDFSIEKWPQFPSDLPPLKEKSHSQALPNLELSFSGFQIKPATIGLNFPCKTKQQICINPNQPENYNVFLDAYSRKKRNQAKKSYEHRRIANIIKGFHHFIPENSEPYIWMKEKFGKAITQKEFNKIYKLLKQTLPINKKPNRDVNRSSTVRLKWMSDIWEDENAQGILKNVIANVMRNRLNQ